MGLTDTINDETLESLYAERDHLRAVVRRLLSHMAEIALEYERLLREAERRPMRAVAIQAERMEALEAENAELRQSVGSCRDCVPSKRVTELEAENAELRQERDHLTRLVETRGSEYEVGAARLRVEELETENAALLRQRNAAVAARQESEAAAEGMARRIEALQGDLSEMRAQRSDYRARWLAAEARAEPSLEGLGKGPADEPGRLHLGPGGDRASY